MERADQLRRERSNENLARKQELFEQRIASSLRLVTLDPNAPVSPTPESVTRCPECDGMGWRTYNVPVTHPKYGEKILCEHCETGRNALIKRWERMFTETATPAAYKDYTMQNWFNLDEKRLNHKKQAIAMAYLFIDAPNHKVSLRESYRVWGLDTTIKDTVRNWLIFQGIPGLGKTSLAMTICNELNKTGTMCLYLRVAEFLGLVQSLYSKEKAQELKLQPKDLIDQASKAPVLLLDDFNIEGVGSTAKASNNRKSIMEDVVRWRYNNSLPTIITLNDDQAKFKEAWGERIASPVLDASHWVPMGGEKLRDERHPTEGF